MHKIIIISLLLLSTLLSAKENMHHAHKAAIGIHGMALISDGTDFYASHMPLADSMHAHQIIFTFKVKSIYIKKITNLTRTHQLLSLVPEKFDLLKLMDGSLTTFNADIYAGHFERGGKVALQNVSISIENILLSKGMNTNKNGSFYVLPTSSGKGLLIHQIGKLPSFDQILAIDFNGDGAKEFTVEDLSIVQLTRGKPFEIGENDNTTWGFSISKQLYLELQDFR